MPLSCLIQERYEDRGGDKVDSGTGNRRLLWKRERISSRVSQLTSYLPTAGNSSSTTIHDALVLEDRHGSVAAALILHP